MKKIYKYATGDHVPDGAIYLWSCKNGKMTDIGNNYPTDYEFVWHYFLVEE